MEFRHLKTFLDLCYTLNFTKTADRLQYAQSSITAQIKSLETEFQLQLFERLGKKNCFNTSWETISALC